jgi:hypothetical protein
MPSGEWMVSKPRFRSKILEFRYKWYAERYLKKMLSQDSTTYIKAGDREYFTEFSKEEFCIVAVNDNITFNSPKNVPAPPRARMVK